MTFTTVLAWILLGPPAVTMFLYALAAIPSLRFLSSSFWARILASYLSLSVCAIYGVVATITLRLVGYGTVSQWTTARSFKWVMRFTTGIQFTIDDPHG